jgi:hypothetical protein
MQDFDFALAPEALAHSAESLGMFVDEGEWRAAVRGGPGLAICRLVARRQAAALAFLPGNTANMLDAGPAVPIASNDGTPLSSRRQLDR